jgi:hypothetical protein
MESGIASRPVLRLLIRRKMGLISDGQWSALKSLKTQKEALSMNSDWAYLIGRTSELMQQLVGSSAFDKNTIEDLLCMVSS